MELCLDCILTEIDNSTYQTWNHIQEDLLVPKDCKAICNNFHLSVNNEFKSFPPIYWLLKLNKKPTEDKLTIAASVPSTKSLSKSLTSMFKLFWKQIDNYNNSISFFSVITPFWTLPNEQTQQNFIDIPFQLRYTLY